MAVVSEIPSPLTSGAIKGAASALYNTTDHMTATLAVLSFTAIDGERDLEVAAPTISVGEIIERRASLTNRFLQNFYRGVSQ